MTEIQSFNTLENDNLFLQLLDEGLTDAQKAMYTESFSAYMKYDQNTDFVVDLDDHWKGLGYLQKVKLVEMIKKSLEVNMDYSDEKTCFPNKESKMTASSHGGNNIKKFYLTVNAFKNLCMLAGTAEGKEIRKYFVAIEGVTHKYLKRQLELKEKELLLLTNSWIPSQDEINEHARILRLKGDKSNVFYQGKCQVEGDPRVYIKPGSVRTIRTLFDRLKEHERDFAKFYLFQALECTDAEYVESEYKKLQIIKDHNKRVKGKKINNTETLLLDETLTTSQLISAPFTAGREYILDSPPAYSQIVLNTDVDVEKEKTKQKQIDLDLKKLEFEVEKWRFGMNVNGDHEVVPREHQLTNNVNDREGTNEVAQWVNDNIIYETGSFLDQKELYKRYYQNPRVGTKEKSKFKREFLNVILHSFPSINLGLTFKKKNGIPCWFWEDIRLR